jgi:hypothetical protein
MALVIRETQIKTTIKYYFTSIRMGIMEKTIIIIGMDKLEPSYIAGENTNVATALEHSFVVPPKITHLLTMT